ncbi:microtubule-associated protein 6 homolog [Aplochiton taeniatus]
MLTPAYLNVTIEHLFCHSFNFFVFIYYIFFQANQSVMAWPCISRVCCLARFWNQFDKSDLSVPLTIQNYSDIAENEVRSVTKQVPADLIPRNIYPTPNQRGSPKAAGNVPGPRRSLRGRREPSFNPREDYQPPGVPFQSVTQYKQDYKPWPIPKKEIFPWISNGGSRADKVSDNTINSYPNAVLPQGERLEKDERGRGAQPGTGAARSSYSQEYRAWTGEKPAKSSRKRPTAPYASRGLEANHLPPETSYQAAFSGDHHHNPASSPQPISAPLQASVNPVASGQPPCNLPEKPDLSMATKGEEQLVKTKLSPNPSAVFQGGSRMFNI